VKKYYTVQIDEYTKKSTENKTTLLRAPMTARCSTTAVARQ
jgi:hypothetical protein